MTLRHLSFDELLALHADPGRTADGSGGRVGTEVLVVDLDEAASVPKDGPAAGGGPPAVVIGTTADEIDGPERANAWCDAVVGACDGDLAAIERTVAHAPVAAICLVTLLRSGGGLSVDQGLLAESAVYSTLLHSDEFHRWRTARPVQPVADTPDPVLVERIGDALRVVLNRPARRNAYDRTMRDALDEALLLARIDDSIQHVELSGNGPSFCSGGDLDEFGTAADPARSHLIRLERSVGRALDLIGWKVSVQLHGACIGSGIELPAFADTLVADPEATFALPELSMGLIPGAGGTVSIVRRIGRHRTARWALSGQVIDARSALAWGLVDKVGAHSEGPRHAH